MLGETKLGETKMKIDALKEMPVNDLWALHERTIAILSSKISEQKARLDERLKDLTAGPSIERSRRYYPPVLPKFRNPVRPSETWAGRGKLPRWLSLELESGRQLDEFKILI